MDEPTMLPIIEARPSLARERIAAWLVGLGLVMVIVSVRFMVGTPGTSFWCAVAALVLLWSGITLAWTPPPKAAPATIDDETAQSVPVPDYIGAPPDDGISRTGKPPSPFAGGG